MFDTTRFNELLTPISRTQFTALAQRLGNDKHSKGFRSWDQLLCMVYAQLTGQPSLRSLEASFNSNAHAHYHLGSRSVHRSTLSRVNETRDADLFRVLCESLMAQLKGRRKRELKQMVCLLDSTPIQLKGLGYDDWVPSGSTYRTRGLKLHLMLDPDDATPLYQHITPANVNDISDARLVPLKPHTTYVFDKAYCDYNWWQAIEDEGSFFVTRLKNNASVEELDASPVQGNILADEQIRFRNRNNGVGRKNNYRAPLRRVTVACDQRDAPLVLVTNDTHRSAEQISELYRSRWQIELFFKWLKQNLRIKRFLGRSENAVRTQIYIALITYLLLHIYRITKRLEVSLRYLLAELSATLFERPNLNYRAHRKRQLELEELMRVQTRMAF